MIILWQYKSFRMNSQVNEFIVQYSAVAELYCWVYETVRRLVTG